MAQQHMLDRVREIHCSLDGYLPAPDVRDYIVTPQLLLWEMAQQITWKFCFS